MARSVPFLKRKVLLLSTLTLGISLALFTLLSGSAKEEKKTTKISVARDILMPVGLPVVSSYHSMKENHFLNTRIKEASPLEALGDLFLTPSRFIFAGKDIDNIDSEGHRVEVKQSFQYEGHLLFKTVLAVLAFPVGEVLGGACKGLAYCSPQTRERHRSIQNCLHSPVIRSNGELYKERGISTFVSEEFVPCQNHQRDANVPAKHKIEIETLKEISQLFEKNGILYWIDCGTCLGAYRYGGFIPWDWDIDISIMKADHENVKRVLQQLDPKEYQIQDWSAYSQPGTFLKLYIKKTKTLIDIYHYDIDAETQTLSYVFTYENSPIPQKWKKGERTLTTPLPYSVIFPLKRAHFDGLAVWAPNQIETFLKSKYGENLDPTMLWDEATQTYKKVEGHPYYKTWD